ncbi:MAG: hypothetical protein AUK06_02445 [Parcubacteria group bacterium CG2_30_36_18]|uniref:Cell division protein FtsL n=2 Tax=Candidatus Nealsoniibacteriota TaxID=1817911 RepID=A0A2M8DL29_9BACT|nr:MAG: hypothetical protein AUK06_02445 [Parcubacteria group bacterium CG2_30_36_18]PIR72549.1 MAG: hypothetical protein COU41_00110 [Candidatus Nealsonbacteria bacterium CG10_big_fil_rev_8_21_14_0_10_36_228]PJB98364.1 MAG: hypothetical protein CO078_02100 [Candidatus Nealsonbacteria bacterium CG_4_9_14_0_8_um_filter_36_17]
MNQTLTLNPRMGLSPSARSLASRPFLIRPRLTLNLKLFWGLILISIIFLLVFYVFQVNFLTREIYLIQNSEEKLKEITQENENLEIEFSKSNSLANLEKYLSNQNFEKASQVKYIKILESEVVTK